MSVDSREVASRATLDEGLTLTRNAPDPSDADIEAQIQVPWRHTEGVGMAVAFIHTNGDMDTQVDSHIVHFQAFF